ncbi:MAG: T9SS type A sorting domain-containing protein, partial [Saprospiraceae bacterium]|nr:T9SS type A sorting domain-containing protein [Saprospiraceae bacterium]
RTWSFTDACGNRGESSQMISICGFDANMASSAVGNTIWLDENENGIQDLDEIGINDIKTFLYKKTIEGEVLIDSTVTSTMGGYTGQFLFHHLMPGIYRMGFEIPTNMYVTLAKQGENDTIDSDADQLTGWIDSIVVDTNQMLVNFDLGLTQSALILPIELKGLSVSSIGCRNIIQWTTATEINADRFELQRAFELGGFHTIRSVNAKGSELEEAHYEVIDESAQAMTKYRLKMIDMDGSYQYSEIVAVQLDCSNLGEEVLVYPNPANDFVYIDFSIKRTAKVDMQIVDKLGRIIRSNRRTFSKGQHIDKINLENLPTGVYLISVNSGTAIRQKTVIKTE